MNHIPESPSQQMQVSIAFGALAPRLADQLSTQGFYLKPETIERLEGHRHAIKRLQLHGLITDSVAASAFKKLLTQLIREIKQELADSVTPST